MADDKKDSEKKELVAAATSFDKIVPKFCTSIGIALLENKKNVVLTLAYGYEGGVAVIDRIAIDVNHVEKLHNVLELVLEDIKNDDVND